MKEKLLAGLFYLNVANAALIEIKASIDLGQAMNSRAIGFFAVPSLIATFEILRSQVGLNHLSTREMLSPGRVGAELSTTFQNFLGRVQDRVVMGIDNFFDDGQ
jgi:hypothetical protein